MFRRQAALVALLVAGTATLARAQSDLYPFRRFGSSRGWIELRRDARFDSRALAERIRARMDADRFRFRTFDFSQRLADRLREQRFERRGRESEMRNRAFELRHLARHRQLEIRDRVRDHLRDRTQRLDRYRFNFRFDRPLIMRRRSRTI